MDIHQTPGCMYKFATISACILFSIILKLPYMVGELRTTLCLLGERRVRAQDGKKGSYDQLLKLGACLSFPATLAPFLRCVQLIDCRHNDCQVSRSTWDVRDLCLQVTRRDVAGQRRTREVCTTKCRSKRSARSTLSGLHGPDVGSSRVGHMRLQFWGSR